MRRGGCMRRAMIRKTFVRSLVIALMFLTESHGQHHGGFPSPPGAAVPPDQATHPTKTYKHLDTLAMEREARELSILAASIPTDVELLKKGLLPKDVDDKLRRIEKLSKQLRGQVRP